MGLLIPGRMYLGTSPIAASHFANGTPLPEWEVWGLFIPAMLSHDELNFHVSSSAVSCRKIIRLATNRHQLKIHTRP